MRPSVADITKWLKPEPWHVVGNAGEPAFQNSWVNYAASNDATYPIQIGFMKDSYGFVHLRGNAKNGTAATTIFTLPAGYRPLGGVRCVVMGNAAIGQVNVYLDGTVVAVSGGNAIISLDQIIFKAEL